ncbi:MAG: MarR family winged helix-turn-helix transcriptional regulator [Brevinema sp.]
MKGAKYESHKSTGLIFWQVSTLWQRAIKETLRQFDLTHTQYVILAVIEELSEKTEDITQKKISDFSMIDPMTLSTTLRLLEKKGFTQRIQSELDSRANRICNTKNGHEILKNAIVAVESVDTLFFFEEQKKLEPFRDMLLELKVKNEGNPITPIV